MQFTLLPISLLISFAAAQSSTAASSGTTSVCAAQPVLEACLASTQAIAAGCASTDYKCLCEKNNDVLTYTSLLYPPHSMLTISQVLPTVPQRPALRLRALYQANLLCRLLGLHVGLRLLNHLGEPVEHWLGRRGHHNRRLLGLGLGLAAHGDGGCRRGADGERDH